MTAKMSLKEAMTTSISEVLETMFFMSLEFDYTGNMKECIEASDESLMATRLDFNGPLKGWFNFAIPDSIIHTFAENFMGIEKDQVTAEFKEGTIKELTNMIAGNTFSCLDPESVYNLGIPEVVDIAETVESGSDASGEVFILVETIDGSLALKGVFSK